MTRYDEVFTRLDQCLVERMHSFHTPALVMALTDRNSLVRLSTHGYADLQAKIPVTPENLFALGSVGKSFTALAALQACESGLLDLNAPVKSYLPWFEVKSAYAPITVHHLLTHSSGLPRGTDFSPDPRGEVYALRDLEVGFAPGKHFCYSDTGYKVLGLVLQAVTEKTYAELIHEKILQPLEMTHTYAVTTASLRPQMPVGYRNLYDDRPIHTSHPLVPAAWVETDSGDGCIVSTAEDMARFARMLLNKGIGPRGPLISPASYQKMVHPMIEEEGEAYSYGLYLFDDDGFRVAGHGGDVPGYQAYMWLDLANGLGSVVMMTEPYTPRASFLPLEFLRAAYLGLRLPDPPPLPDFTHVINPKEYVGVYQSPTAAAPIAFESENHHLVLVYQDLRIVLEQHAMDCFYANHPDWDRFLFRFERSLEGVITEVSYGPEWFINNRYHGPTQFEMPAGWAAFSGHYYSHNPWSTNFRVFIRKGQLMLCEPSGDEEVLVPLSESCFRIGEDEYIPERLYFDQCVEGQTLRATRSGCHYYRSFIP